VARPGPAVPRANVQACDLDGLRAGEEVRGAVDELEQLVGEADVAQVDDGTRPTPHHDHVVAAECAIRIAIGDADSSNVQARGCEEQFGHGIESRCRLALMHYRPLTDVPGIEIRTHATTLYNSLYRSDDQVMVNAHVWGVNAYKAPVWHLRRNGNDGMFDTYIRSFNAVWATASPVAQED
jgi:hypothetical protein